MVEESQNEVHKDHPSDTSASGSDANLSVQQEHHTGTQLEGAQLSTVAKSSPQQLNQGVPQRASAQAVSVVKVASSQGAPSTSNAAAVANTGATGVGLNSTAQATTAPPGPLQNRVAGQTNRPQVTVVTLTAQNGANKSSAAFAVVKLPPTAGNVDGKSKVVLVKLSPNAGNNSTTVANSHRHPPGANASALSTNTVHVRRDEPPPPYSAYASIPNSAPTNVPSSQNVSLPNQSSTPAVRKKNEKFLVGSYTVSSRSRFTGERRTTQYYTHSNEIPCCVFAAVLLLLCTFICLTPLSLICTVPYLYYISVVSLNEQQAPCNHYYTLVPETAVLQVHDLFITML